MDGTRNVTTSGRIYDPMRPLTSDFCIEDIAHTLSLACRWQGRVRCHYSIAQHSTDVAMRVNEKMSSGTTPMVGDQVRTVVRALLHDSPEAYTVDIPAPLKPLLRVLCLPFSKGLSVSWSDMESSLEDAILRGLRLGTLCGPMPQAVKDADRFMALQEARDLFDDPARGHILDLMQMTEEEKVELAGCKPLVPLTADQARRQFLNYFGAWAPYCMER